MKIVKYLVCRIHDINRESVAKFINSDHKIVRKGCVDVTNDALVYNIDQQLLFCTDYSGVDFRYTVASSFDVFKEHIKCAVENSANYVFTIITKNNLVHMQHSVDSYTGLKSPLSSNLRTDDRLILSQQYGILVWRSPVRHAILSSTHPNFRENIFTNTDNTPNKMSKILTNINYANRTIKVAQTSDAPSGTEALEPHIVKAQTLDIQCKISTIESEISRLEGVQKQEESNFPMSLDFMCNTNEEISELRRNLEYFKDLASRLNLTCTFS